METNSVVFFSDNPYSTLAAKPILAAWQLVNPGNIGSLVRLADNAGVEEVCIIGDHFQLRESAIKKTGGLSMNNVLLKFLSPEIFFKSIPPDYSLIAVETSEQSLNVYETNLPEKVVFVVGNEKNGIPDEVLMRCNSIVHIPMIGKCKSMNVSHAMAVVLFEWQRQMLFR